MPDDRQGSIPSSIHPSSLIIHHFAMFFGYNTNGLAHHELFDAVELLAEIGYRGVAITIDHNALPPYGSDTVGAVTRLRRLLERLGMRSVIETGARYLLDHRVKHEPTLLSDDRQRRIEFYKYAVDCAARLGSDCVSLWSGVLHEPTRTCHPERGEGSSADHTEILRCAQDDYQRDDRQWAMDRLVAGLGEVLDYAAKHGILIAFEPEPGMLIDSMRAVEALLARIDAPNLRLTLDIGHLQCQGETPIAEVIRRWAPRLANVHIEDMRRGVHEHLMFGEGEIDFPPVLRVLGQVGYTGGVYVELSRHSHEGPEAARKAFKFLASMK
jgi:L-ribulose-5-phosphate 3-epimerase